MKSLSGFTLIELVLVIIVTSILAGVTMINWPGASLSLHAETEKLVNNIRYTQTLSMTQGLRYCLRFSGTTYQVINSGSGTAILTASGNSMSTLSNGVSFGTFAPAGMIMLVFDGKGVPYASTSASCSISNANNAIALSSTAIIPLVSHAQTYSIIVTPETGRVVFQ